MMKNKNHEGEQTIGDGSQPLDASLHGDFLQELSLQENLEHRRSYLGEQGEGAPDGVKEHGIIVVHVGDMGAGISSALIHALAARHNPHVVMGPLSDTPGDVSSEEKGISILCKKKLPSIIAAHIVGTTTAYPLGSLESLAHEMIEKQEKNILMMIESIPLDLPERVSLIGISEAEDRMKKEQEKRRRKHANKKRLGMRRR